MSGPPEAFLLAMKFLDKHILGMGCMYKHIYRTRAQNSFMHIGTHLFIYNWNTYINQHKISTISPWIVIIPNKKMVVESDNHRPTGLHLRDASITDLNSGRLISPGKVWWLRDLTLFNQETIYIYITLQCIYIYILYYSIYIYGHMQ